MTSRDFVFEIEPAELKREVDQADAGAQEKTGHEVVDPQGQVNHIVDVLGRGPAETP